MTLTQNNHVIQALPPDGAMKWSTKTGHRVKALKCHNEVHDNNRKQKETELHGRVQAPVVPETLSMPADDGPGLDNMQGFAPI